jgi:cyclophilin family peptidyl-prolyl cis-trans isomerase
MHRITWLFAGWVLVLTASCNPRLSNGLRKNDLHRDVQVITTRGTLVIRLSDSTPLHRDNFLRLVKKGYYDSLLFHRVIRNFVIQTGDPDSREGHPGKPMSQGGNGGPGYTIPAEFRPSLLHHRGAVGAARLNDDVNPTRASSGSQFYIVQGKRGAPHLDQRYTIFGEVVAGMDVVDSIAAVPTSGPPLDRPITEVRILKMRLIHRRSRYVK